MNEKLLQYLWNFKIFKRFDFKDTEGNAVEILDFGIWNHDSGPDFFMAKVKTKDLVLVGNIELHLRASDWIFHNHSGDPVYGNIILHAVFLNDTVIDDLVKNNIPTIELKDFIDENLLWKYEKLLQENHFIPCEELFNIDKIPPNFYDETLLKKLDEKSIDIEKSLELYKNNYEAVLFHLLAYAFGLKVNAAIFRQIAENIDFSIIQKIRQNALQLEALFFGKSGWLEAPQDEQMKIWQREFNFLKTKFGINGITFPPKFLRLRPPNFPTIRLSQLANLYHREQNLFSKIIEAKNYEDISKLFVGIKASDYWENHFNFGKISSINQPKTLTQDFIDLVILNAVLPLKYAYHRNFHEDTADEILDFYSGISPEKNTITKGWRNLGAPIKNALNSQAMIWHYKTFCQTKNCLNCSIALKLLRE